MNFKETCTELRRRLGFIYPNNPDDIRWMCEKIYREHKEVFDRLA